MPGKRDYAGVMPLRGKIRNVSKMTDKAYVDSKIVQAFVRAVGLQEGAVGKPLPQGQGRQRQHQIETPFGQLHRDPLQVAERIEAGGNDGFGGSWRPLGTRDPAPLGEGPRHDFQQPVGHGERQRRDREPFVQAIEFVEAAQHPLDPDRPRRQDHGDGHRTEGQHTRAIDECFTQCPEARRKGARRQADQPQAADRQENGGEE